MGIHYGLTWLMTCMRTSIVLSSSKWDSGGGE